MLIVDPWLDWQAEVETDPHSHIFVSGGLAAGKTNLVAKIAVRQSQKYPGARGAIAAPDFEILYRSIDKEIRTRLSDLRIRAKFDPKRQRWIFPNGSEIWYESFHKSAQGLKGPEWDWGIADEIDNPSVTEDKFDMFDGRVGRDLRQRASGKLWAFLNPVSHGHFAYQWTREMKLPGYVLHEIATHRNRRFLREGYIEKQEVKYPPGTPGHDRFLLGKCGIPHPHAVFRQYKYQRDRIDAAEAPAMRAYFEGMHLHDGQPVGWLRVGVTESGQVVPVREKTFVAQSPEAIAEYLRDIYARHPDERSRRGILADSSHSMFRLLRRAKVNVKPARTDISLGVGRLRNLIPDSLRLLRQEDGRCATPKLLVELEEHRVDEQTGKLREDTWSLLRPLEFIAASRPRAGGQDYRALAALGTEAQRRHTAAVDSIRMPL